LSTYCQRLKAGREVLTDIVVTMSRTFKLAIFTGLLVGGLVAGPATAGAAAGCVWQPTVLPVPVDGPASTVTGADSDGWLAGTAQQKDVKKPLVPLIWRNGEAIPLEAPFGQHLGVSGVNASGEVIGSYRPTGFAHGVVYRSGAWRKLPESELGSAPEDINAAGEIVGLDYSNEGSRLVIWPADITEPRELLAPDGESAAGGARIDDDGSVAGWTFSSGPRRGYVWAPDGTRVQLKSPIPDGDVTVKDIRNGRVVGAVRGPDGTVGAQWDTGGNLVRTFPGRESVLAVNREGWVLGSAEPNDGIPLAWRADDAPETFLIPDGYREIDAMAFNDFQVGGAALRNDRLISAVSWERTCS
jgi:hypothetical protein